MVVAVSIVFLLTFVCPLEPEYQVNFLEISVWNRTNASHEKQQKYPSLTFANKFRQAPCHTKDGMVVYNTQNHKENKVSLSWCINCIWFNFITFSGLKSRVFLVQNFQAEATHETVKIFEKIGQTGAKRKKGRSQENGKISP